jgi:hypothetical protein
VSCSALKPMYRQTLCSEAARQGQQQEVAFVSKDFQARCAFCRIDEGAVFQLATYAV